MYLLKVGVLELRDSNLDSHKASEGSNYRIDFLEFG